jgi:hypothetical protein
MQVPCAHFFLTNPRNTPPRQHRLGKTFSAKNLSGSDSDTTYPDFSTQFLLPFVISWFDEFYGLTLQRAVIIWPPSLMLNNSTFLIRASIRWL